MRPRVSSRSDSKGRRRTVASSNIWLPSASRTATVTSADIPTLGFKNLSVTLDMTTVGTGSVTLTINGKDAASGKYRLILAGAAVVMSSVTDRFLNPRVGISALVTV